MSENALSVQLVRELYELHDAVGTLIDEREIGRQKAALVDWQKHMERLLFNHLANAGAALSDWAPKIPERGDFTPETWDMLQLLGTVADPKELVQKDAQSQVNSEAANLQRNVFQSLSSQIYRRWDSRPVDQVTMTLETANDLRTLNNKVTTQLGNPDSLAAGGVVAAWSNLVDELLNVRLEALQNSAKKIWSPRVLTGTLSNAVSIARSELGAIERKVDLSQSEGLRQIHDITLALQPFDMKGLELEKTMAAIEVLGEWDIPTTGHEVRGHPEYTMLDGILRRLDNLDSSGRRRGEDLAQVYRDTLHDLPEVEPSGINAGVLMARQIREDIAGEVRREIKRSFLDELERTSRAPAFEGLFKAMYWNVKQEIVDFDDKEVAEGLDRFFNPKRGDYVKLRRAFNLVDENLADVIGTDIFPPEVTSEDDLELMHYFLRDFQTFLLTGDVPSVEDVKIDFWIQPRFQSQTVWDTNADYREHFYYPEDNSSPKLQKKTVLEGMGKLKVSDWGFAATRENRSLTLIWSEKNLHDAALSDRDSFRLEVPSCLGPMLLAWQGKPRDDTDPREYVVSVVPDGTTLEAPMMLIFNHPLPPRPASRP